MSYFMDYLLISYVIGDGLILELKAKESYGLILSIFFKTSIKKCFPTLDIFS